jgi:hypothetical protein
VETIVPQPLNINVSGVLHAAVGVVDDARRHGPNRQCSSFVVGSGSAA